MESACDKIKLAVDEVRMLVLGVQVLISLQFQLFFQSAFEEVSKETRSIVVIALLLLLATFALLIWGPAYHRIVSGGGCELESHRFITFATCAAMWPLTAGLSLDVFVAFDRLVGRAAGATAGLILALICWALWHLLSVLAKRPPNPEAQMKESHQDTARSDSKGDLHKRVELALTEARVVLPGAQAMLGFQFVTMFTPAFEKLPRSSELIHLTSLALTAITVVLLMTPAAFHRIAERGEDSERLVELTGRFVMAAMVPLAMGMSGEIYVVLKKVTDSTAIAATFGVVTVAVMLGMWFGYTILKRETRGTVHTGERAGTTSVPST